MQNEKRGLDVRMSIIYSRLTTRTNEPWHEISNNVVCTTSKGSDQPAHKRSLIRAFASCLNILWLLSYWLNIIWSSKLKRRLHRLIWVHSCQNATLLDITCHGSNIYSLTVATVADNILEAFSAGIAECGVHHVFYAPNFERTCCFGLVRPCVRASVRYKFKIGFWNFIDGLSIKK